MRPRARNSHAPVTRDGRLAAPEIGRIPDFVIAGVQKAGTSSLGDWLRPHPQVFMPGGEVQFGEPHFFDRHWVSRGMEWYRSLFAAATPAQIVGEKTPEYIAFPQALARMASCLPEARIIVSLRDPVERFHSHWRMIKYKKLRERRSLREVVHDELETGTLVPALGGGEYYLARGLYMQQLRRLMSLYPPERILVVLFDDLCRDPGGTYERICRFLGLDPQLAPPIVGNRVNPSSAVRKRWALAARTLAACGLLYRLPPNVRRGMYKREVAYEPMDEDLRRRLADYYAEPNAELARWLGRDLSHWICAR